MAKKGGLWMQKVREKMERKGTKGAFGKATASKIAAGKRAGGLRKRRAVLAETFKRTAKRRTRRSTRSAR